LPRQPFNPAFMHPEDMQRLALNDDMRVRLTTRHGSITATVRCDATLRPGVIAITHGWASDPTGAARNVNEITGDDEHTQPINFMPQLTAQSVTVEVCA
jgi:anaerobic selenocysteine-containing dehydrogenase